MKLIRIIAVAAVLSAASCAKHGQPDQKAEARQQWNSARAGVMYGLAQDQFKTGNFPAARQTVGDALKLDPDNAPLHVLSARIEIEQGNIESAQRSLVRAGELKPDLAEADYLLGVIHQRWQRPNEALASYRGAVSKAPGELAYLLAESEMLVQLGRTDEAISLLTSKVTYFENSAAIRDAVGQLLTKQNRHAEAIPFFRQACVLACDAPAMRENLALALYRAGQHREAHEHLSRLTREHPDDRADLWLALGECQLSLGRNVEARASFESASRVDPMLAPAWLGVAKAAMRLNDHRRAELSIRKAISTGDQAFESQLMMGYLRLQQNRPSEAMDAFRKASLLRPDDTTAICMIGFTHEKLGDREQAMEHYARALRLSPRDPLASRLLSAVGTND